MNIMSIPRGKIYHKIFFDFKFLAKSFYLKLENHKVIEEFESLFAKNLNTKFCVSFPYARSAVYHSLKTQNFPVGSEIIMPPITIKPMLDAVLLLNLKPVFVDIDLDTLSFELEELKKAIGEKTKAVLLTYLFGIVPDIEKLFQIFRDKGLFVIEDFSQCLNGVFNGDFIGTFGDVGVYSSSSTKTLDTFGGGICITSSEDMYKKLKIIQNKLTKPSRKRIIKIIIQDLFRNILTSKLIFSLFTFQIIKFLEYLKNNSTIYMVGKRPTIISKEAPNFWFEKYSTIQAKAGIDILKKNIIAKQDLNRIENTLKIKQHFKSLNFPLSNFGVNVYWQCLVYSENVGRIRKIFRKNNIDTASTSLLLISELLENAKKTQNAQYLINNSFFIPNYSYLTNYELNKIRSTKVE